MPDRGALYILAFLTKDDVGYQQKKSVLCQESHQAVSYRKLTLIWLHLLRLISSFYSTYILLCKHCKPNSFSSQCSDKFSFENLNNYFGLQVCLSFRTWVCTCVGISIVSQHVTNKSFLVCKE